MYMYYIILCAYMYMHTLVLPGKVVFCIRGAYIQTLASYTGTDANTYTYPAKTLHAYMTAR